MTPSDRLLGTAASLLARASVLAEARAANLQPAPDHSSVHDRDWSAALDACDSALPGSGRGRLIVWNDAPGRTQAEVLGLLDRAIEREGEA